MENPMEAKEQAVFVFLNGTDLPDEVYANTDLGELEDLLAEAIETGDLGEYDGHEIGPTEVQLYMYGPDAEALFARISPVLNAYPLCQRARVTIRAGGPDAPESSERTFSL